MQDRNKLKMGIICCNFPFTLLFDRKLDLKLFFIEKHLFPSEIETRIFALYIILLCLFLFIVWLKCLLSQRINQQKHTIEIMIFSILYCAFLFEVGDGIPWLVSCLSNKEWESLKFSFWRQACIISYLKFFSKRKKLKKNF